MSEIYDSLCHNKNERFINSFVKRNTTWLGEIPAFSLTLSVSPIKHRLAALLRLKKDGDFCMTKVTFASGVLTGRNLEPSTVFCNSIMSSGILIGDGLNSLSIKIATSSSGNVSPFPFSAISPIESKAAGAHYYRTKYGNW